jgi:hypothetical protein
VAVFLHVPIADDNEDFEDEVKTLDENREKVCKDIERLFLLLQDRASTQPQPTIDSMKPNCKPPADDASDSDDKTKMGKHFSPINNEIMILHV